MKENREGDSRVLDVLLTESLVTKISHGREKRTDERKTLE
jgi:hypothetical protein